jgi:hypothetical protein
MTPKTARLRKRHAKALAKAPLLEQLLQAAELSAEDAVLPEASKRSKACTVNALLALQAMNWWEKPYKAAVRALVNDAGSFAEFELLEMVRSSPWPVGNAAAQMLVARANGKPTTALASLILEIDRRRARDLDPGSYEEGWCRHGFSPDLSKAIVAILMNHPDALGRIRAATQDAGVKPVYEAFLRPLVKKAIESGKVSVPVD